MHCPHRSRTDLTRAVVFDGPHADHDAEDGDEDERHEDEDPHVAARLQPVAHQQLEHQQHQVHRQADQHRLEVDVSVAFHPAQPARRGSGDIVNNKVCASFQLFLT